MNIDPNQIEIKCQGCKMIYMVKSPDELIKCLRCGSSELIMNKEKTTYTHSCGEPKYYIIKYRDDKTWFIQSNYEKIEDIIFCPFCGEKLK